MQTGHIDQAGQVSCRHAAPPAASEAPPFAVYAVLDARAGRKKSEAQSAQDSVQLVSRVGGRVGTGYFGWGGRGVVGGVLMWRGVRVGSMGVDVDEVHVGGCGPGP